MGYTLPPGWTTTRPSGEPGGYTLPEGWSTEPKAGTTAPNSGTGLEALLSAISQLGGLNPNPMMDFGKGATVGVAKTGLGIGDLFAGQKPGTTADALGVQSTNLPQQAGESAEGIVEFAAPGMAGAKAPALARMAMEGGANALSGAARDQSPLVAGATGALMPAGRFFAEGAKKLGPAVGGRLVNSVIRPLEKEFRFGRNAGEGIVREGIMARSVENLAEKAGARLDEVGELIGEKLKSPMAQKTLIDLQPLLAPIDDAVAQAVRVGDEALAQRLRQIKDAPIFTDKPLATVAEAAEIKTLIGKATRWTGEAFDKDINRVRAAVYGNLNDAINKAVPGVKALNARYADLLSAVKSAERQISLSQRQAPVNLMDLAAAGAGFFGSEGDPMTAITAAAARRGLSSAAFGTGAAQVSRGAGQMAPWVLELMRALSGGVRPANQTPSPTQTK